MTRILVSTLCLIFAMHAQAAAPTDNIMDELNPFDPNIESILQTFDAEQEKATGQPSHIGTDITATTSCYRQTCAVWALVVKSKQAIYFYVNGAFTAGYFVSTGMPGLETPTFDTHPDGRVYDKYTSTKFPEGDYKGLGNMPYAVFISGGFAIHGTTLGNIKKLGTKASHGCIRVHPEVGLYFNKLVRHFGAKNTWVTVQE
jgi:lipoprotein-anchoring transpeptidase ErfK/SrfK